MFSIKDFLSRREPRVGRGEPEDSGRNFTPSSVSKAEAKEPPKTEERPNEEELETENPETKEEQEQEKAAA